MSQNPIFTNIDFDKEGIQHGFLNMPHSRDDSAWGSIMIPITQMKNGNGATALITGGNHGDEYEGPVALFNFAGRTDISDIHGRVIVIPAMNYPAFQAATRVSPVDGVNLNRCFPGKPHGTVTQVIADYFSHTLLPLADYVLDIHSGGKTLDFLPFAAIHELPDKQQEARCEDFMKAFGAPYQLKMLDIDAGGMYDTQVESMGKVFVTTELGGGGTTTPYSVNIAKRGVNNFLVHAGILDGEVLACPESVVNLDMPDETSYLLSQHTGLLEPVVSLGDRVREGDLMARVHITERTAVPPYEYFAPRDGLVISRHLPSWIKMGDCLNVIGEIVA
ncbi:MAG: N-alpha-acetyl diaminobutyric acid deacetylase DoeB [Gammaproteobacteria bacterium]|nr:N-alpha-acetyl diaminobutyric acid deacetylase DoeB [Gammaproteobacteria bacterium]